MLIHVDVFLPRYRLKYLTDCGEILIIGNKNLLKFVSCIENFSYCHETDAVMAIRMHISSFCHMVVPD